MEVNEIGADALLDLMDLPGRLDRWAVWQNGVMTDREYHTLVELFPGLQYASGITFEHEPEPIVDEATVVTAPDKSISNPPSPPETPMPQIDTTTKQAVVRLASLSASARSTMPTPTRELLLMARDLNLTLEDVLELLDLKKDLS